MMKALVKSVISGDTLVLAHPTKIPPLEKMLTLAHIQAPRLAKRNETTEEVCFVEYRIFMFILILIFFLKLTITIDLSL